MAKVVNPERKAASPVDSMMVLSLREFGIMAVEERVAPAIGPDEVLIRVAVTGICGSDLHGFTGENGRRTPGQVMGHEASGWVHKAGAETGFTFGEPVTFNPVILPVEDHAAFAGREQLSPRRQVVGVDPQLISAFAEFIAVPATNVVRLSASVPIEQGALVEPLAVALHGARRAGVGPGKRILVIGGGPIGQSTVLASRMLGARDIVVSEIAADRRALCAELGAQVVDPFGRGLVPQLEEIWGDLADIAIDAVGISRTIVDATQGSKIGATIGLIGMGSPRIELDAYRISTDERTLVGSFCYSYQDFIDAAEWIVTHSSEASHLISEVVSLADAPAAFDRMATAGEAVAGKVLVRFAEC